eukprot:IDg14153t1
MRAVRAMRCTAAAAAAAAAAALLALAAVAHGAQVARFKDSVSASHLRDPLSGDAAECMPGRSNAPSPLCDPSGLLPPRNARRIEKEIRAVYNAYSPYVRAACNGAASRHGFLVEIAVVRRIAPAEYSSTMFAQSLFRRWRVGDPASCGNGVLLLVAWENRRYSFATGY